MVRLDRSPRGTAGFPLLLAAALAVVASAASSAAKPPAKAPRPSVAEPWDVGYGADAAAVLAAAEAVEPPAGASVHVLFDEAEHSFDEAGRHTARTRLVYQVLDDDGVASWSAIEAQWAPWYQERPAVRGRVIAPDGRETALDPATLSDDPVGDGDDLYDDRRVLRAPFAGVVVGAVIEEEVVVRSHQPFFAAGEQIAHALSRPQPVRRGRLVIEAPAALTLRWETQLAPGLEPQASRADGRQRLTFDYGAWAAFEGVEDDLPADQPLWPAIRFSTGSSWQAVGAAYARLVDERAAAFEKRQLPVPAAGDRTARIDAALRRLQDQVRYTGLELGAASLVPATPAETVRRRFGDCKDQATLLVAALRAAAIPAQVALLSTGGGADVAAGLPGLGAFDHAIVYVPGEPALWIDPTDPRTPASATCRRATRGGWR